MANLEDLMQEIRNLSNGRNKHCDHWILKYKEYKISLVTIIQTQ